MLFMYLLAPPEGGAIMIWEFLMSMGGGVIDFFLILWWIFFFTIFTMDNLTNITSVNLKRSDDSSNTGEYVSRWCFYSISSKYKIKKIAGSLCIRTSFLPFREGRQSCMFVYTITDVEVIVKAWNRNPLDFVRIICWTCQILTTVYACNDYMVTFCIVFYQAALALHMWITSLYQFNIF
mgnify:FL=1